MAHTHDHEHDPNAYYVGQLCMIGICGALGAVAILWWSRGLWFLAPAFRLPVLVGGLALLVLVIVRAVSLWVTVGKVSVSQHAHGHLHGHAHEHDHGYHHHTHEHCDHDHAHEEAPAAHVHAHDHDHDHDHGSAPWRYTVLLIPIVFFLLTLPNKGFSSLYVRGTNPDELEDAKTDVADRGFMAVGFLELERARYSAEKRAFYEGKSVSMKGEFQGSNTSNRRFTLVRFLMVHCAADAIPLDMVIECREDLPIQSLRNRWVEVTGKASFRKLAGKDIYVPVLSVATVDGVRPTDPEPGFFLQNK